MKIVVLAFVSICAAAAGFYLWWTSSCVYPVKWSNVRGRLRASDPDIEVSKRLLQRSARYNLNWAQRAFAIDRDREAYVMRGVDENSIRPAASAAFGLATLLQTHSFDAATADLSETDARLRTLRLIRGVAFSHKSVRENGWGDPWQSAWWATMAGQAGWMMWDELDWPTRRAIESLVTSEADYFIRPEYKVPYWIGRDGTENFPGDTKAEENAWNAALLQLALAMMPKHAHAARWKLVANELMISAFALKSDLDNTRLIPGKEVRQWLGGYNVRDDGAIVNHNQLHPDYMATPTLNMRSYLVQPLAGQPAFPASSFNADKMYHALAVGLPIYQPGVVEARYPDGTDWSTKRVDIFYLFDVFADRLHLDTELPHRAIDWQRLRAKRLDEMQNRSPDGSFYLPGEFDAYPGREQLAMQQIADSFLLQWLH